MKVVLHPGGSGMTFDLDDISYAIGVVLRAGCQITGEGHFHRKIKSIGALRQEKGFYLVEAKALVEFALVMIEQCEGNKLPAMLNPID